MSARILVVGDVPAYDKLLEEGLSAEYFDVLTASNGADALEICARAECDIILLDVMMPDIDGFEICRRLKSNPATHFIPVVMVTALDSPADRVRGLDAGADDFLTKPVSDVVMIARVRSLTRLKMMTDELRMRNSSVIIFSRVSERTRAIMTTSDTGLVRKSSAPASSPRTRSEGLSSAVTMTTGMKCVAGFDFSRRQTSNPSMSGIITSSRMISHSAREQIASA